MFTFLASQSTYHQCGDKWFEPSAGSIPTWANASVDPSYMRMEPVSGTVCQQLSTTDAKTIRFQHHGGLSVSATFRINSFTSSQTLLSAHDYVTDRKILIRFDASCDCVRLELWLSSAVMWQTYTGPGTILEGDFATLTFRIVPAFNILDIWKQSSVVTWDLQSVHTQVCFSRCTSSDCSCTSSDCSSSVGAFPTATKCTLYV